MIDQDLLSNESARGTVMFALPFYGSYVLTRAEHDDTDDRRVIDGYRAAEIAQRNLFDR